MKSIEKSSVSTANAIIDPYLHYAKSQPWYAAGDIYKGHFTRKYGKRKLIDDINILDITEKPEVYHGSVTLNSSMAHQSQSIW